MSITSAYKDEFGDNFTSAIPTNVFGKHDNLYVEPILHRCGLSADSAP